MSTKIVTLIRIENKSKKKVYIKIHRLRLSLLVLKHQYDEYMDLYQVAGYEKSTHVR